MKKNRSITAGLVFSSVLSLAIFASPNVRAWDEHELLMSSVLSHLSPQARVELSKQIPAPCAEQDHETLQKLIDDLRLNPSTTLTNTVPGLCTRTTLVRGLELLASGFVDEPDHGMDENLPRTIAYDPMDDRAWMGGYQGQTSKGFRHMFFGGWKLFHPIATFQVPARGLGHAPDRADLLARKARELIRAGQEAWGFRVLAWSLHYVQDLAQPFHSMQIVDLRMVPWSALFAWPPGKAFQDLVKETTRTIANYHWAFEGYTRFQIMQQATGPFAQCLLEPSRFQTARYTPDMDPLAIARETASASVRIGSAVGSAEMGFFGTMLKNEGVDLPKNPETLNYSDFANRADLREAREALNRATCPALANAIAGSQALIEWTLQP